MTDTSDPSRILIVDDIEENLRVLTDTLMAEGYQTLQARNGERALQIAARARPDLILMDIKMPVMDGYETLAHLKADPATAAIPVIFISALNMTEDKVKGFEAGAVDYVSKPFQKEEVIARVGTHLRLRQALRAVEAEKAKSETLLLNVLPAAVAAELKETGTARPQEFPDVTILFSDFVGFTARADRTPPGEVIATLNELFTLFDTIMDRHGCERIKTIGDAYFAACGIPLAVSDHADRLVRAALDMRRALQDWNRGRDEPWLVRIGLHSGPATGGIVGTSKYIYDVFGDTVNTASRMEAHAETMKINLSQATCNRLSPGFQLQPRPVLDVKGKGPMQMYYVD